MKTPQNSTNVKVELCKNMETSNKKVTDTNSSEDKDDVKEVKEKYPVENDEKDCESAKKSESMGKELLPSSDLPTDVETDEAQIPPSFQDRSADNLTSLFDSTLNISPVKVQIPPSFQDRSADNLTSLFDSALNISPVKSKVGDVELRKMRIERPNDEPSCDKAAKDIINLITTLTIGKQHQKPAKENDDALSVLQKIDETLAKIGRSGDVKDEANEKMKSRGFGDLSPDSTLADLQPGELEDYFERQNIRSAGIIPTETESFNQRMPNTYFNNSSQQERNRSTVTLPPFEHFGQRNIHFSPTTPYSSNQRNIHVSEPPTTPNSSNQGNIHVSEPPTTPYSSNQGNIHVSEPPTTSYSSNQRTMGSVTNPPAFEIYPTSQATSNVTNPIPTGVSDPALPGPSFNFYAKRTKLDTGFEYPVSQYPATNFSFVNSLPAQEKLFSTPFHDHCQPPPAFPSVSAQDCSPTVTVPSIMSGILYQPPNRQFSTIQSPPYSSHSESQCSSSYTSDLPGGVFSPCPSSQFATSPRSQNSSSPTVPSYFSPEHSSDSGISLSPWYSCNFSPYSNVGSPSSTHSSASTQPYVPVTQVMTTSAQPIQGSNVPREGVAPPTVSNTLHYTNQEVFDYTDEDGDCILHILLLVYGNLVNTGRDSQALGFLNYVAKHMLPHPMIETMLDQQNYKLQTPLYLAVKLNLLPMVELLIQSGADVNIQGRGHEDWVKVPQLDSPLHVAASMGDRGLDLVKSILRNGAAEVNITNTEGETPLHVAAKEHDMMCTETTGKITQKKSINVVKYLLDEGADMEAKEYKSGKTALMFAIESKDVMLVKTMLEKCDSRLWHSFLNESTNDLNTCMHLAFGLNKINERNHVELIRLLIKKGGEAEAENSSNQKAKDFAPNVHSKAMKIWK